MCTGMKILLLSPFFSPNVGGAETHLDDLCQVMVKRGHQVVVVTYQPLTTRVKGAPEEHGHWISIYRIPWLRGNFFHWFERYPPVQFLYLVPGLLCGALWHIWREEKSIQVVHAHGLAAALVGRVIKFLLRIPLVVSSHAVYNFSDRGSLGSKVHRVL